MPTFTPPPPSYVPRYDDNARRPGERAGFCPYIRAGLDIQVGPPNTTFADLEGNRVGAVTVLTRYRPVGCRFYFANDSPRHAVGDILPFTFRSVETARNAMVLIGRVDPHAQGYPNFLPGVDGISFQTEFFMPDGKRDWAFVFTKGSRVIVIHTDQTDASANARSIAAQIAKHF